jgi:hypothetical protein
VIMLMIKVGILENYYQSLLVPILNQIGRC